MLFYFAPVFASLTIIFFAVVIRFLDVIEREPLKPCLASIALGLISYPVAFKCASIVGAAFNLDYSNIISQSITVFSIQTLILVFIQLLACIVFYCLFMRQFQTLPDFVLYFLLIGVGFNTAEALTSAMFTVNPNAALPSSLYFSPFGYGQSTPLIFSVYGAALFLIVYRNRFTAIQPVLIAISFLILSILCQLAFSAAIYFLNFSSEHLGGPFGDISSGLMTLVGNISMLASVSLISIAVLYDLHVVQVFASCLDGNDKDLIDDLQNPVFYILSANKFLWKLLDVQSQTRLPRSTFPQISRLSLRSWKKPQLQADLLAEANKLITLGFSN